MPAPHPRRPPIVYLLSTGLFLLAIVAIVLAGLPLDCTQLSVEGVPVTAMARRGHASGPAVVIGHGFSGSRQIMYAFGDTLAHRGYTAYLLDFAGHGANRQPLAYSRGGRGLDPLQSDLDAVVRYAAARHPGVVILGHWMGGGTVTGYGVDHPEVAATINVSSGLGQVSPALPRNYLIMVGAWEFASFTRGAHALLQQAGGSEPGVLYGDLAEGSGRRLAVVPGAEHILVLFSPRALGEAVAWLDGTFGVQATGTYLDRRLAWVVVAYLAALTLARPLAARLLAGSGPMRASAPSLGPTAALFAAASVGAPLVARLMPDTWMPLAVAGYVSNYWLLFGLLTLGGAWLLGAARSWPVGSWLNRRSARRVAGLGLYLFVTIAGLGHYTLSPLIPIAPRWPWLLAMLPGALLYFASGEILIRGQARPGAALIAEVAHKGLTLLSLTAAVFLLGAPFFLALLLPVLALLFAVFVVLNRWLYQAGRNPLVGHS